MTDFEKEEFWKGLTRLYDATVKNEAAIEKLTERMNDLITVVLSHEKRIGRLEG